MRRALGEREHSARSGWHVASRSTKIVPWVNERTANGKNAEFFVVLADQADLSRATNLTTKAEKGGYVYDALRNKSQATQGPVLQWLRDRGIENQSFYIVNAILVRGSREIAEALAARPDVARVEGNPQIKNILPQPEAIAETPSPTQRPETIEPGINYTHAPDVWALGFRGQGITVGGADTGQRWTHNAFEASITAAGMESQPITTITGMTPFTTALEIHAAMIPRFRATTLVMARIRSERQLAMTVWVTRSAWRQQRNG